MFDGKRCLTKPDIYGNILLQLRQNIHFLNMGCTIYKKIKYFLIDENSWEPFFQPSSKFRNHKWELKFGNCPPINNSALCDWDSEHLQVMTVQLSDHRKRHLGLYFTYCYSGLFCSHLPNWVWSEGRRDLSQETRLCWELSMIENLENH